MRSWGVGAAILCASSLARADTCPAPSGGNAELAAIDARDRIEYLHRTIDQQAHYATLWKWSWIGVGSVTFTSASIQALAWAAGNNAARDANITDNLVVAGFSILTPTTAILAALRVRFDAPKVDALLARTNDGAAGTCLVLARIEELFKKSADEERFNTGPLAQVAAFLGLGSLFSIMAVEAATASVPAVRDAHWINAITNTVGGIILTEAQIFTTPTGAANGYKRYLRGDLAERKKIAFSVSPMREAPGVSFKISF